jgi:hypothetical protein
MKKLFVVAPLVLLLTACGSLKYSTSAELSTPSLFGSNPSLGDEVKYPSWYTKTPKDAKSGELYAVATEYSKDMQFSVDKTMLSAKRELASMFSSHVSSLFKEFTTEIGESDGDVIREIERTTKKVIKEVNLVGVERTQFKVQHDVNGGYRTWVQLRYSVDNTNKLLVSEIKKNRQLNAKLQSSKAFKELQNEIQDKPTVEVIKETKQLSSVKPGDVDLTPVE